MKSVFALLVMMAVVAGCATVKTSDIEFWSEADPKVNIKAYKSYAWLGDIALVRDPARELANAGFNPQTEMKFLIDRELRDSGFTENAAAPDLLVAAALGVDMASMELVKDDETHQERLRNVPKGGVALILVDAKTKTVVWLGHATADVQEVRDAEFSRARMDYAISKLAARIGK